MCKKARMQSVDMAEVESGKFDQNTLSDITKEYKIFQK